MKPFECLYDAAVGKDFVVVTLKSLITESLKFEEIYDSKISLSYLPRKRQKLGEGRYLVHIDNVSEYITCYSYCLDNKVAFVVPQEDFNSLLSEFKGLFRVDDEEEIVWVKQSSSFNDYVYREKLNSTLELDIYRYNHFYTTEFYKVPRPPHRKSPEYYQLQYLIEHEDDEKFQTAINFYKYIREIKSVVMKPVYSTDDFIDMLGNKIARMIKQSGSGMIALRVYFKNGKNRVMFTAGINDFCKQVSMSDVKEISNIELVNAVRCPLGYTGDVEVRRYNSATNEDTLLIESRVMRPDNFRMLLQQFWGRAYEKEVYIIAKE